MSSKNLKEKAWTFCFSLLIFTILLLIIKQFIIYHVYENLAPFSYCLEYLVSDFYFLLIIAFFCTINFNVKNKIIKWISNIIILFLILLFYIDCFTIYYFQSHETIFSIIEIGKFWWNWFTQIWISRFLAFIIVLGLCVFFASKWPIEKYSSKTFSPKNYTIYFIIWVIVYFIQSIIFSIPIYNTRNIISINLQSINKMVNEDILMTNVKYEDYIKYEKWYNKSLNIILVFAESISAIDSYHLWGKNNMPYLDKIQKDGITFTNFIANWINSCNAHVSALIWDIPVWEGYEYKFDEWLANFLNNLWYNTTFISTAPLWFLDQRWFLRKVGFQKIIWEEAFEDKKKYSFNSAPDEYLYEKALDEIKNQTWKFFIWLQTISFHGPYSSPYCTNDGDCMYQTLNYVDEKLYDFYEELQRIRFFDNWILIIVWDHRKRSRAELWESYVFWETWKYRSVATVVWTWIQPGTINSNIIQHTDFYYSIKKLLWSWNITVNLFFNDIFSQTWSRTRWIMSNAFTVLKWNKYYIMDINTVKTEHREIYNYYLATKKKQILEDLITKRLNK